MPKFSGAIAVVVTSRSSSLKYTISVHAVHAGAERNVCNVVVSTETPQTTTYPSQTLLPVYKLAHLSLPHSKSTPPRPHNLYLSHFTQMRYRCKYNVSSTSPNILEVYIIYLHGDTYSYVGLYNLPKMSFFRFEITETARVFGYILFTMSTSRYDLPVTVL